MLLLRWRRHTADVLIIAADVLLLLPTVIDDLVSSSIVAGSPALRCALSRK